MTRKDIILLLSPSAFFGLIAITAFFTSAMIQQRTKDDGHQQKFATFITNVQSGKWQLTTDRWLEGMRRADATAEAYRQTGASLAEIMDVLVWTSLAGIFMQLIVVLSIRKRLRKTMPKSLQATAAAPGS